MNHRSASPHPPTLPGPLVLSRRRLLGRMAAVSGAVAVGPSLLAACGGGDDNTAGGGGGNSLTFSNWPAYIDEETVDLFREETGINLTYTEDFNDNTEYFAKIQPDLSAGRPIAADIIAPTYWLVPRLIQLGYLEEIPFDDIPNSANLVNDLRNPSWDPDGRYSLPWTSGMTGIAYNVEATGRELTSVEDLFDPEFRGRIGMLSEMRDTVGLVMMTTGVQPEDATFENAQPAFEKIEQAKADGQIRQFTGNDYMDDLASGGFVACISWSGDISQLQLDNPNLRFAIPDEGGLLWSDTMVIPAGARNIDNAAVWMNYVYEPENAARLAEYIGFITPVEGVQEILRTGDEEQQALAENPLMFPDDETEDRLKVFAPLDEEEEARFDERFSEIIGA
jgi:spermidine/putrescine transport system substrate-binding protein